MGDQAITPAATGKPPEQRSLHKREVLWALAIIIGLAAAPTVGGAYAYYIENSPVEGLYGAALFSMQHSPSYAEAIGMPIEPISWTRELINYPTQQDDARAKFFVTSPSGDIQVLIRGRFEGGKWTLTYLEVQPMFGGWFIDGELGGFQREGRLEPIEI